MTSIEEKLEVTDPLNDETVESGSIETDGAGERTKRAARWICCCKMLRHISAYAGSLITVIAVIIMSFADLCIEIGTQRFHPVQATAIFSGAMFVTSTVCTIVSGQVKRAIVKVKSAGGLLLLCGISNSTALTLINIAISVMPVGDAIAILRCMPIFAGIFGWIWLKQQFRLIDVLFTLCCIAGVTLIARPSFIFRVDADQQTSLIGVALALGSAVTFAFSFVIGGKLSEVDIHPFFTITVNAFFTVVLNTGLVLVLHYWTPVESWYFISVTTVGGVFHAVGQILVFVALSKERTVVVTVILALEMVFVYILQIFIVGLIPHWLSGLAAVLIFFACIGITVSKSRQES